MSKYSLSHRGDQDLLHDLDTLLVQGCTHTALVLAHIAEADARKLYVPLGYPSMFAYCVERLHMSEDAAYKRIRAGRAAREFPAIFVAVADGRLHLTAVVRLAPHLTAENVDELLAAATHKTRAQVEQLLAERFPQPGLPTRLQELPASGPGGQLVPEPVGHVRKSQLALGRVDAPPPKVAPLSAERFALQVTIGRDTHDKLRYAQALLGHAVPSGDLAEVLDRALDSLVAQLEKQKFAKTSRPGRQGSSADPRHIPAHVKRAVFARDGGRCTFVAADGHCCGSPQFLEYDHVDPVACGGEATVDGIRLRCRAHNQFEAECAFGAGFMVAKREAAKLAAAEARAKAAAARAASAEARAKAAAAERERTELERDPERSVVPWLRQLGYDLADARKAAKLCEHMTDAPLEARIKAALRYSRPGTNAHGGAAAGVGSAA